MFGLNNAKFCKKKILCSLEIDGSEVRDVVSVKTLWLCCSCLISCSVCNQYDELHICKATNDSLSLDAAILFRDLVRRWIRDYLKLHDGIDPHVFFSLFKGNSSKCDTNIWLNVIFRPILNIYIFARCVKTNNDDVWISIEYSSATPHMHVLISLWNISANSNTNQLIIYANAYMSCYWSNKSNPSSA